ncbi:MAG TPA: CHASE domain-containing protein [Lysobacter sp.]|nr:CHASE domain-containing protein [Lysobacter sp.]
MNENGRQDPSDQHLLSQPLPRHGYMWALIVLIGAVAFVLAVWMVARDREMTAARAEFVAGSEKTVSLLMQRLDQYELVTRSGVSLVGSVARPTQAQWRDYVAGLNIDERFPAVVGLGFVGYVRHSRLPDLIREWESAGYGHLQVHPAGEREEYAPVLYFEPMSLSSKDVIGYDVLAHPVRRAVMIRAMESGQARLSAPMDLVADGASRQAGLAMAQPVYRGGERPAVAGDRRRALQGWVTLTFRIQPLLQNVLGQPHDGEHFKLYDITEGEPKLMAMYGRASDWEQYPAFVHTRELMVYGRRWQIVFHSPPLSVAAPQLTTLDRMLQLGLFSALLLSAIAGVLAHTEARARRIAHRLTEDYRRSEMRFRVAIQYSAIGKALLDSEGRIVDVNPALAEIVGRRPETLIGVPFESLFDRDPTLPPDPPFNFRGGVYRATRRLKREGSIARHAQLTYAPVPGNIGQDITGLVQVEDVTERLLAEARIRALNRTLEARVEARTRELQQTNQELEAFAYSVSHDLRAPLRAIEGFSRILAERYGSRLDEAGIGYLNRVRKAASRMGELIEALLKMSRLARSELRPEHVDLSRMATEIVDELRMAEPQRQVDVSIAPGMTVMGDATLLRNMLANLFGNAWKFTRQREHARIEFHSRINRDGLTEYCIRDNGAGFDPAYIDKLFRPFQRLHGAAEFAGHGIGLASVKRIVERHGGTIRAEGEPGVGATFLFTLPGPPEPDGARIDEPLGDSGPAGGPGGGMLASRWPGDRRGGAPEDLS